MTLQQPPPPILWQPQMPPVVLQQGQRVLARMAQTVVAQAQAELHVAMVEQAERAQLAAARIVIHRRGNPLARQVEPTATMQRAVTTPQRVAAAQMEEPVRMGQMPQVEQVERPIVNLREMGQPEMQHQLHQAGCKSLRLAASLPYYSR
jgi:hypothetical protein